ncbi:MAG TPA: 4Fe-4S binding protein [Syntrophomonadaceae bacterium]|nr:4Fe-4S binding protein [Syntrophomonadaceae bacterium]
MDSYKWLQERLNTHAAGAPAHEAFTKILKIMFSPEEAEAACHLTFVPQSLNKLAKKSGMDEKRLEELLEALADRGAITGLKMKAQTAYCLLPTVPGIFEFPFMRADRHPQIAELSQLWDQYHKEAFAKAFAGSPTPQMRVIPVQKAIPLTSEVLTYDQVAEMINKAKTYSVTNCACRVHMGFKCDHSIEVCLAFDNIAKLLVDRDRARWIDKEEALNILSKAEDEGLVHCMNNSGDKPTLICNCCSCCCTLLRGITEFNAPSIIATAGYIIEFDEAECIGCQLCLEDRCPMKIISAKDDIVDLDSERCIGCGLCVSVCPTGALRMQRRGVVPPVPSTGKELMTTILNEKGKLTDFTNLNRE